ncbi:MAG: PDZ domain-containing protein [Clostridia bacterium]|nr:PDZ domain-containing protein [Clostridia bacterium]
MKKYINRAYIAFILVFLVIALIYISNITNLPENVILFEGETLNLRTILGVNIETEFSSNPNIERLENNKTITVSSNPVDNDYTGKLNLKVSFLGFKVKEINVEVIENAEVVPLGSLIGVKLYTNGVLVVGMSEITGKDMERYKPYEGSGILEGDIIVEINDKDVTCTNDLTNCINEAKGASMKVVCLRDGEEVSANLKAVKASDNSYKVGLWVRDTAAGVGTASFYEPDSKKFASLGHGIIDSDTEELVEIGSGEIVNANILSVIKGKEGSPRKNSRLNRRKTHNRYNL